MILYPTDTIYGIGVNPFDTQAMEKLFAIKGRDAWKVSAWLVRTIEDIRYFAELSVTAEKIAQKFLPGPLTLVLPAKDTVPEACRSASGTIGLRITADPLAQDLIERHYTDNNAPLTCTSANVSGQATPATVPEIIKQFETYHPDFPGFDEIIDDGARQRQTSTVVRVEEDKIFVLRMGAVSEADIYAAVE